MGEWLEIIDSLQPQLEKILKFLHKTVENRNQLKRSDFSIFSYSKMYESSR